MEILIPIVLFVSVAATVILRGPIGKAMGERIAGRGGDEAAGRGQIAALQAAMEDVHHRVAELEERVDFTERVLARARGADRLPEP